MTSRFRSDDLLTFSHRVLIAAGLPERDAEVTSRALIAADLCGIDSHGIAHLSRYVRGLQNGSINAHPTIRILRETPSTALVDGDRGLGFVVAHFSMQLAIRKAQSAGSGIVIVQRSTHYGAAGYWAAMALEHGMIGFSLTNSSPKVAPTRGARGMIGTNPIALAVPTGQEPAFVLDMATSVVPAGRLEVYQRLGKPMPEGWAIDPAGRPITDAHHALERARKGQLLLLPLGGADEVTGSHKGYGLGLCVEILSSILAGYAGHSTEPSLPNHERDVGQFFGALSVEAFRPLSEFSRDVDARLQEFKKCPPLPGFDRVLVAGQREFEIMQERQRLGIPLHPQVIEDLRRVGIQYGIPFE